MAIYEKYLRLKIDRSVIGLDNTGERHTYFCTPKGASVIGWTGVDGIHYCFIRGFGDKVFAVSPSNLPGEQVHILADSFEDFLRLLLACGTLDAVEQAYMWNKEQFEEYLEENKPTKEQLQVQEVLQKKFSLVPMEEPFEYIKDLQRNFDYKKLKFEPEYYDTLPVELVEETEWKVYFESGFWKHHGRDKAGEEITVGKSFKWINGTWHVPAVYVCKAGLVVDYFIEIEAHKVKKFMDKAVEACAFERELSDEERDRLDAENPLNVDFISKAEVNGVTLQRKAAYALTWTPDSCCPEGVRKENGAEWAGIMRHYSLDPENGWVIHRCSYVWDFKKKPVIKSLKVNLEQHPVPVEGLRFKSPMKGKKIVFTHPGTRTEHALTILDIEKQEMNVERLKADEYEYPTHFSIMSYTLEPELSPREFSIRDCVQNDKPIRKKSQKESNACSVGIIGGADGPTAIIISKKKEAKVHSACSALHFEPVDDVEWKIVYMMKMCKDMSVELIG